MAAAAYGPASMYGGRRKSFEAEDGMDIHARMRIMGPPSARHSRYSSVLPVIQDGSPIFTKEDRFSRSDGMTCGSDEKFVKKNRSLPRAYSDSSFGKPIRNPTMEVKRNHSLKVNEYSERGMKYIDCR